MLKLVVIKMKYRQQFGIAVCGHKATLCAWSTVQPLGFGTLFLQADIILPGMWSSKTHWAMYVLLNLDTKTPLTLERNKSKQAVGSHAGGNV